MAKKATCLSCGREKVVKASQIRQEKEEEATAGSHGCSTMDT